MHFSKGNIKFNFSESFIVSDISISDFIMVKLCLTLEINQHVYIVEEKACFHHLSFLVVAALMMVVGSSVVCLSFIKGSWTTNPLGDDYLRTKVERKQRNKK